MSKKTTKLPTNIGAVGGGVCPSPNSFGEKVCNAIVHYCPHIKDITKVGNTIVATNSCGEVVFECPLLVPDTDLTFNPTTCAITYTDAQGQEHTIDLSVVLAKAQDDLQFDPVSCILSWASVNGVTRDFDLSVILDKIKDNISWNAATCELSVTASSGQTKVFDLSAILDKLQDSVEFDEATCRLSFTAGNGDVDVIDLSTILDKSEDNIEWDPETCRLKYTSVTGECTLIQLTDLFAKLRDELTWSADTCQLTYRNASGDDIQIFDIAAVLDKVKVNLEFDPATCILKFTGQDCVCHIFDIGAAIADKVRSDILTVDITNGTFTHTAVDGVVTVVNICQLAERCKPSMTTVEHADGSKTICFNDGYGLQTCCDVNPVVIDNDAITVNGSSITFTSDNDQTVVFDVCDIVAQNCNATFTSMGPNGEWTFVDNAGNTFNYTPPQENVTILVDNGNTFTYTNEAGQPVTVDKCCTNVTEDADNYYITDHNGNIATVCKRPVKDVIFNGVTYQPDASGSVVINYTVPAPVVTTLVDNGNGSFTYINEDGTPVTVEFCPVCPEVTASGDINLTTSTGPDGQTIYNVEYNEVVTTLVDNGNGSFTYINEDGTPVTVEFCPECPVVIGAGDVTVTTSIGAGGETIYTVEATHPVYLDKDGSEISGGSTLLQPSDFANSGVTPPTGSTLLGFGPDGECVAYLPPETPEIPEAPDEVWIGDGAPPEKGDGAYKVWFNCNDGCVYYCQEDGTWLAPKGCPIPAAAATFNVCGDAGPRVIDQTNDVVLIETNVYQAADWPFDCPMEQNGQKIYKSEIDGTLYTNPQGMQRVVKGGGTPAALQLTIDDLSSNNPYQEGPELCIPLTNPDQCCPMVFEIWYELLIRIDARQAETFTVHGQLKLDNGTGYRTVINPLALAHTNSESAFPNTGATTVSSMTRKDGLTVTVPPGETQPICVKVCGRPQPNQPAATAALDFFTAQFYPVIYACGVSQCR